MSALDRVLAALDAGLQSSDEHGYPGVPDDASRCARCLRADRPDDAEICAPCRSWLLGDSDVDPSGWYPLTVEEDGSIHGYLTPQYAVAPPTELERRAAMYRRPIRVSRLDAEGRPTGDSNVLAGYAIHHRDGDHRNNDMSNLEVVPVAGDVDRRGHDEYMALREDALRRLAEGLEIDPELVRSAAGVYDWAREEEARVAAERQDVRPETEEESCLRVALGESWEAFSAVRQVQALQRRIERSQ